VLLSGFWKSFLFCFGVPADGIIPFQMETASGEKEGLNQLVKGMLQKEPAVSRETDI